MSNHIQKLICILIIPLYAALVFDLKEALAILPNIEVVTFLLAFALVVFIIYVTYDSFNFCFFRNLTLWC